MKIANGLPREIKFFEKNIIKLQDVPSETGIYFLYSGDILEYIGKTVIFPQRILGHIGSKSFDSVYFLPLYQVDDNSLDKLESLFISFFRPPQNRKISPRICDLEEIIKIANKFSKRPFTLEKQEGAVKTGYRDFIGIDMKNRKKIEEKAIQEIEIECLNDLKELIGVEYVRDLLKKENIWIEINDKEDENDGIVNEKVSLFKECGWVDEYYEQHPSRKPEVMKFRKDCYLLNFAYFKRNYLSDRMKRVRFQKEKIRKAKSIEGV